MKLLPLLCLLTTGFGPSSAQEIRPGVVTVSEGEDALLPCASGHNINIFHWKKDNGEKEKKEVFFYENGKYYGHHLNADDQNEQFRGRVEFFKDELKSGNASIKIKNTGWEDNGTYICVLFEPHRQEVNISLNVGAASVPYINIIKDKSTWRLLECKVQGVPEPEVEWRNGAGEVLRPTEKYPATIQRGRFHIKLTLTVTKSDNYTCVATQRDIYHQINNTMPVSIPVVVAVVEGKDVLLPCSPNFNHANKNLVFTWTKEDYEVFLYNRGQVKEDDQFKGRLTYFEARTKSGIASIKIHNTQMSDSGHYSCHVSNVLKSDFILQVVEDPARSVAAAASVPTMVLMVVFGITIRVL